MCSRSKRIQAAVLLWTLAALSSGWAQQTGTASSTVPSPVVVSLDEAIRRAQANEPAFAAALAENKVASLDRSIARAALLPSAVYHNQILYTQPNGQENQAGQGVGSQPSPRFIANNAVREYASQGIVNETIGLAQIAEVKRVDAASAFAQAQLEVARRGLVATVVSLYSASLAADQNRVVANRAASEADAFAQLTQKREVAREAA